MFNLYPAGTNFSSQNLVHAATEYVVDSWQRSIVFVDTLRQRGNKYLHHLHTGQPPVLSFPYTVIRDGRDLKRPVNYSLVHIQDRRAPGSHQGMSDDEHREHAEITEKEEDPAKRPVVIIDPRAGHGPGIGGSKQDSQVGNALSQGHPVYFVIFSTEPIPGQTLPDVHNALGDFVAQVHARHPQAEEPLIIGNCQAGWASTLIGAERPDISGPLVLNGAPLSFWSSIDGQNPMTYKAGLWGGVWIASFLSDLGNGRFDGANLVANFEDLNPANTLWSKLYNLYARLDTEVDRFLNFEKWWGGFYLLNEEEIHFIVDSLFVGNKLEHGNLDLGPEQRIRLQNIEEPVLVFSSHGDNITPPHQAMNWIKAVYGSVEELIRQKKVLVYMVHEHTGHLGIFVSQSVARKEHQQILEHIELIRYLPPGLYEMVIEDRQDTNDLPGYLVRFEERSLDDLIKTERRTQSIPSFQAVAAVSRANDNIYRSFVRPWVRMASNEFSAELLRQLHPLRLQRYALSDLNPLLAPIKCLAPMVTQSRRPADQSNPFKVLETEMAKLTESTWEAFRTYRDSTQELFFKLLYDNPFLQNHFLGAQNRALCQGTEESNPAMDGQDYEQDLMHRMRDGGFLEAAVRCLVAVIQSEKFIHTEELKYLKDVLNSHDRFQQVTSDQLIHIIRNQAHLLRVDATQALQALQEMLPLQDDREEVLAIAEELAVADTALSSEEKQFVRQVKNILNL
ncbi:MAG: DUF3141 domain-containing protein [Thermodesulfobacteriota bacterium]